MCKITEAFETLLPILCNKVVKGINQKEQYGSESLLSVVFKAYNQMQEEEFNGDYYIFNINDKEDLKYLVDKDIMTACDISHAYQNSADGFLWYVKNNDNQLQYLTTDEVRGILCSNIEPIMRCVLMYCTESEDYKKVYNYAIADALVSSDFRQVC